MKLRNLILLPIAGLTTAVPTLTLASCSKGIFGGFELGNIDGYADWPFMMSKKAVNLKAGVEYTAKLTSSMEYDNEESIPIVFAIFNDSTGVAGGYLNLEAFENVECIVDNHNAINSNDPENVPYFVKTQQGEDYTGFTFKELFGKRIQIKFKLKNDFSNASLAVTIMGF